jgi:hypothetical protein
MIVQFSFIEGDWSKWLLDAAAIDRVNRSAIASNGDRDLMTMFVCNTLSFHLAEQSGLVLSSSGPFLPRHEELDTEEWDLAMMVSTQPGLAVFEHHGKEIACVMQEAS